MGVKDVGPQGARMELSPKARTGGMGAGEGACDQNCITCDPEVLDSGRLRDLEPPATE